MKAKVQNATKQTAYVKKIEALDLSILEKRVLNDLFSSPIAYMVDRRFRRPSVMCPIMAQEINIPPGTKLQPEQEQILFTQFNYLKHCLALVRRKLLRRGLWSKQDIDKMLMQYRWQLELRSKIVTANIGLVLAMAKRSHYSGVEFTDLISEGSLALLRATEKFDCSRGVRFSTYACRAILKSFSRAAKRSYTYRKRFLTQCDYLPEPDDSLEQRRQEDCEEWVDEVKAILSNNAAELSETEISVVKMRFSIGSPEAKPMTLKTVGEKLSITKERVRQIQKAAIEKLRIVTHEHMSMSFRRQSATV